MNILFVLNHATCMAILALIFLSFAINSKTPLIIATCLIPAMIVFTAIIIYRGPTK